jgi:thioredoxin-dependent peroxiredoxin
MKSVQIGDRAPNFTATAHDGQEIRLADFQDQQVVVLYFYPKDETPGCTQQACAFRDAY